MHQRNSFNAAARLSLLSCFAAAALACSAASSTGDEATATSAQAESVPSVVAAPQIDFASRPSYLPNDSLVLTFDDAPDTVNTAKVLDVLKQRAVKATFFVNTRNWSDVDADPSMQALVRRIVQEGHELGNHTVSHPHLASLDAAGIEREIAGVEQTVKNIFGASAPALTLFRAPYGEPYQLNDPTHPGATYTLVAPIVARHAVNVGWAADDFDYNCPEGDGDCVFKNFTQAVGTVGKGAYGIVLLHAVHSQTVAALPRIIDYVRANGFKLRTTEDVVRARYGKSSAELVRAAASIPRTDGGVPVTAPAPAGVTTDEAGACPAGTPAGTRCAYPEAHGDLSDGYTCRADGASPLHCLAP